MAGAGYGFIKEIGKLPLINPYADPILIPKSKRNKNFSEYRQRTMRPVDIFPVKFTVNITPLSNILTGADCSEMPITVDFLKGITEYNLKLASIGLCDKVLAGLRVWVNNETASTDAIQNNYKENKIAEQFNNMIDTASKMNEYTKSVGLTTDPSQGTISSPIAAALLDGRHLSLPKIWEKSEYTPTLDLTVKLISPYGNAKSFVKNIAKPLLYLTALTAPSTYDGVTYGMPSNMYVRAYGITFIPLAIADSFSVVRGATNARVNWAKQPLEIAVSMSFKPAMPGFAAFVAPNQFNVDTGFAPLNNIINSGLSMAVACASQAGGAMGRIGGSLLGMGKQCGMDPLGSIADLNSDNTDIDLGQIILQAGTMKIPGVTSLGSIIQSLRPVHDELRTIPPSLLNNYIQPSPILPGKLNVNALYANTADILSGLGMNMSADELNAMVQESNNLSTTAIMETV